MSLINIISAIGNNSSVYPLIVRDCGIEIPTKLYLTYKQNEKESKKTAKNALRERFIDEYISSIIWLGGIPLVGNIYDKILKKYNYNTKVDLKLFQYNKRQNIDVNIKKFKELAPKEVAELEKIKTQKNLYEKLLAGKFLCSVGIPTILMGFILPKLNFKLTEFLNEKQKNLDMKSGKQISFKANFVAEIAGASNLGKMAVTDLGLTIGRVATARNKFEKLEMAFKMLAMMFLNFIAPIWIAKLFDKLSNLIFKTNVKLDPKILNDKEFLSQIINDELKLPDKNNALDFIDKNPKEKFSIFAEKFLGVKRLKNGVRDPRCFVDEKKLKSFSKELEDFVIKAKKSKNVEQFAKKALFIKSSNIIANVLLSSYLLAIGLPKLTFYLRKKITGSYIEPGLKQ